jgi:hypothetical protein
LTAIFIEPFQNLCRCRFRQRRIAAVKYIGTDPSGKASDRSDIAKTPKFAARDLIGKGTHLRAKPACHHYRLALRRQVSPKRLIIQIDNLVRAADFIKLRKDSGYRIADFVR